MSFPIILAVLRRYLLWCVRSCMTQVFRPACVSRDSHKIPPSRFLGFRPIHGSDYSLLPQRGNLLRREP